MEWGTNEGKYTKIKSNIRMRKFYSNQKLYILCTGLGKFGI